MDEDAWEYQKVYRWMVGYRLLSDHVQAAQGRWDIALNAMEKVNRTRGKISDLGGMREAKRSIEEEAKKAVANGAIDSKNELN